MPNIITFDGTASSDYNLIIMEAPTFERPTRKQSVFNVPGKNGAVIFQQNAWDNVARTYEVGLIERSGQTLTEAVDTFEAYLNSKTGYKRLEDSFEPDIFRLAYFSGGVNFTNDMMQAGKASLPFTCRPERFLKSAETPVTVTNGTTIDNPTLFTSKPLIHIEVSSQTTITVSIGGNTISAEVFDYINIDCDTMSAYRLASENRNGSISGSFPIIPSGSQTVGITGTASLVTIVPRFFII